MAAASNLTDRVLAALQTVPDPEIPAVSVVELGIVRGVRDEGHPSVAITPTYTGCPATAVIEQDIRRALDLAGLGEVAIVTEISPPWNTDWITEEGRAKLLAYGIAPPLRGDGRYRLAEPRAVACPQCGSTDAEEVSHFGSTPCKALWRCRSCAEPFDLFKCH